MSTARFVNHAYRDYSRFLLDGGELVKHKKSDRNFPRKVHQILTDGHEDVIVWMPHGRAFKVIDKERLISEVIPKYFVCRKYTTFTRQLNGWGFRRLYQSGQDHGCYYHECFLRGLIELTEMILRLPVNVGKSTPNPAGEPDFYRVSGQYPVPPLKVLTVSNQECSASSAIKEEVAESTLPQHGMQSTSEATSEVSRLTRGGKATASVYAAAQPASSLRASPTSGMARRPNEVQTQVDEAELMAASSWQQQPELYPSSARPPPAARNYSAPTGFRPSPVTRNYSVPVGVRPPPVARNYSVPVGVRPSPVARNYSVPEGIHGSAVTPNQYPRQPYSSQEFTFHPGTGNHPPYQPSMQDDHSSYYAQYSSQYTEQYGPPDAYVSRPPLPHRSQSFEPSPPHDEHLQQYASSSTMPRKRHYEYPPPLPPGQHFSPPSNNEQSHQQPRPYQAPTLPKEYYHQGHSTSPAYGNNQIPTRQVADDRCANNSSKQPSIDERATAEQLVNQLQAPTDNEIGDTREGVSMSPIPLSHSLSGRKDDQPPDPPARMY